MNGVSLHKTHADVFRGYAAPGKEGGMAHSRGVSRLRVVVFRLAAAFLWLTLAMVSPATGAEESAGYVDAIKGQALAENAAMGRRALELESPVYAGDTVETGPDSALRLVFRDETVMEMHASSRMDLTEYAFDPEDKSIGRMLVSFAVGIFRTVTGGIVKDNPARFSLTAPLAAVGIRGTEIGSQVQRGKELHALLSGTPIEVSGKEGPPQIVAKADFGVDVAAGAPVSAPRELTEEEKRMFAKMGFTRQMDIMRRQLLLRARTMVRPPKMKTHF